MMTDVNSSGHLPGWEFGWSRAVFLAVTMLLAGTAPAGTALAGMDRPAVIVPVDTPITVDGDDQEWRGMQAQQTIFQGGKPVTQFKLAADKTAFYACAHVRDTSPLLNNTKILQEGRGCSGGPQARRVRRSRTVGRHWSRDTISLLFRVPRAENTVRSTS